MQEYHYILILMGVGLGGVLILTVLEELGKMSTNRKEVKLAQHEERKEERRIRRLEVQLSKLDEQGK